MIFELITATPAELIKQQAVAEILSMNELAGQFGLSLTPAQAADLVETRYIALKEHGRIEFSKGITGKLIDEFCDSKYLSSSNYAESLNRLLEIFYYLKAESWEVHLRDGIISDDSIITGMKKAFETICQGSLELLADREGIKIAKSFIYDYEPDFDQDHNHEGGYLDDWADEWET